MVHISAKPPILCRTTTSSHVEASKLKNINRNFYPEKCFECPNDAGPWFARRNNSSLVKSTIIVHWCEKKLKVWRQVGEVCWWNFCTVCEGSLESFWQLPSCLEYIVDIRERENYELFTKRQQTHKERDSFVDIISRRISMSRNFSKVT